MSLRLEPIPQGLKTAIFAQNQTVVKPGRKPKKAAKKKSWTEETNQVLGPLKIVKHHHSVKKFQTPSVSRRNARERNRVKQVNSGFATLKNHVPNLKNKTSKVDTLRAAVEYIKTLKELIGDPLGKSESLQWTIQKKPPFCRWKQPPSGPNFDHRGGGPSGEQHQVRRVLDHP